MYIHSRTSNICRFLNQNSGTCHKNAIFSQSYRWIFIKLSRKSCREGGGKICPPPPAGRGFNTVSRCPPTCRKHLCRYKFYPTDIANTVDLLRSEIASGSSKKVSKICLVDIIKPVEVHPTIVTKRRLCRKFFKKKTKNVT